MSDLAFAEIESKVETLSDWQITVLKNKIDKIYQERKSRFSDKEAQKYFQEFSGCVDRNINLKKEREEWRNEKYARAD